MQLDVPRGTRIVLGIDGARFVDALAVIATCTECGYQWPIGIWERPESAPDTYEHPLDAVEGAIDEAFFLWDVWRVYVDPQYIEGLLESLQGKYGEKRVIEWRTNRPRQMAWAVRRYTEDAIGAGDASLSTDARFQQHLKNARRLKVNVYDEKHRQLHVIAKDRPDSPRKMDAAVAAVLSWEARCDCVAKGEHKRRKRRRISVN